MKLTGSGWTLRTKISAVIAAVIFPVFFLLGWWGSVEIERFVELEAAKGLMNFVDAKQQGVIRFLGQNRKLAAVFLDVGPALSPEAMRALLRAAVAKDVFRPEDHKFKKEIDAGTRKIAAWNAYHRIDYVRDGTIVVSTDTAVEGLPPSIRKEQFPRGYSEVYEKDGKFWLTFIAGKGRDAVLIHANARMLDNIVSGEIGNLETGMGAYYLAGVGKTFDYYITSADNMLITSSRVKGDGALLTDIGNKAPWSISRGREPSVSCKDDVYVTNVGATTGCRETMGLYTANDGSKMLGVSMPFYDSDWTIVVEQKAEELLQPYGELKTKLMVVLGVVTLLIFLVLQRLVSMFVKQTLRVSI
ncbi:MAG TPA: hypothetical protein VGE08_04680 [Steroidobacter sp.]|uniref:hypothetical protein n=1 Tax=Steroidobacter sp. TaxID=1978227 RepID=UPI002ED977F2